VSAPVEILPEVPLPTGVPATVTPQLLVFVELHETVADELYGMGLVGVEEIVTVGAGGTTVTVTDRTGSGAPGPIHEKVNVVLEVKGLVDPVPFKGFGLLSHGPPAVQLTALTELQVSVARLPETTGFGEAVREEVAALANGIPTRKNNGKINKLTRENRLENFIVLLTVYSPSPYSYLGFYEVLITNCSRGSRYWSE
jgi:hypothetical protein